MGSEGLPVGSKGLLEVPWGLLEGPGGLPEGLEGLGRRTDRISHSTELHPLLGPLPEKLFSISNVLKCALNY